MPFSFRDGSKIFSNSFLLTKVVFVQVQNPFFAIFSRASGTVSTCKVAAEFGSSTVTWQQLLHSHIVKIIVTSHMISFIRKIFQNSNDVVYMMVVNKINCNLRKKKILHDCVELE